MKFAKKKQPMVAEVLLIKIPDRDLTQDAQQDKSAAKEEDS